MVLLCALLGVACYFDYRWYRIPNRLVVAGALVGILQVFLQNGIFGALHFILVFIVTIISFYPLFRIGTLGAGDLKLFGLCTGFLPIEKLLPFLFFSFLFALFFSLLRFAGQSNIRERLFYLGSYLKEVASSGRWTLYWKDREEQRRGSVCLAGPILLSILMYMGGLY